MTKDEIYAFLASQQTCRVATVGPSGPHVVPLWFTWDGTALWFSSLVHSQRWANLLRDPHTAVVIDAGESYAELRGVELRGSVAIVGEVPRQGRNMNELIEPEATFARKYALLAVPHDGRHAWLKLVPDRIISWDFRKLPLAEAMDNPHEIRAIQEHTPRSSAGKHTWARSGGVLWQRSRF